jgi:hypothetical protein
MYVHMYVHVYVCMYLCINVHVYVKLVLLKKFRASWLWLLIISTDHMYQCSIVTKKYFKKEFPGLAGERTRDLLISFIFSFHHFTAEPQRLPNEKILPSYHVRSIILPAFEPRFFCSQDSCNYTALTQDNKTGLVHLNDQEESFCFHLFFHAKSYHECP